MKQEDGNAGSRVSGSRRTRSQRAPDWTVAECLVLVNVIAAVEEDCLKALSTYQKWKIVAENCTSLDMARTSNQCRRKWDCLLDEHDVIKQWELKMQEDSSYWRLESGRKKEYGLPETFDEELFKAIDNLATMRENQSDTEPDSDPEAGVEMLDDIPEPGSKRQKRRSTPKKNNALGKSLECEAEEKPRVSSPKVEPCEGHIKSNEEKEINSVEWEEQMMVKKLLENAERIQGIVSDNEQYETSNGKNVEDHQTDIVRCRGDKLITCLRDMLNTISNLSVLLQDLCCDISSSTSPEAETLIKFKSSLSNTTALNNWNVSIDICDSDANTRGKYWTGLLCKDGVLSGLRLENMSLSGVIDIDTLVNLPTLRSLSVMNNSFAGPMPEVKKLGALRALYLAYNKFSGVIPDNAFQDMRSLKTVHLEENEFKGNIPSSLASLPALVELSLEGNQFEGKIPFFLPRDWKLFNLSNNQLEGPIPSSVANLNSTSFLGNKDLCGAPLDPCKSSKKGYIITGVTVAIAAVAVIFIYHHCRRRKSQSFTSEEAQETKAHEKLVLGSTGAQLLDQTGDPGRDENVKLQFVRTDRPGFDLEELLRAPAEVLGGGSFGSSYKALISNGPPVVVKRLRPIKCVPTEEFYRHMTRLGRIRHTNLLPPLAFYYRNEDKLLISEFMGNGNLADHLHAKRTSGNLGLDWPTRLRIIKGVARGLAHLHHELPDLALPHGHLKSSNVLMDDNFEPVLTDFGLDPLVCQHQAQRFMAAYKSPEFTQSDRVSRKTDVWSLGILILELLTGKFPANYLRHSKGSTNADLAAWVKSAVREEWTAEVFDNEMMKGTTHENGEMVKLLKIGMLCSEGDVEKRWELKEAVKKIEELKEIEISSDDEFYSSYGSEMEVRSSERD